MIVLDFLNGKWRQDFNDFDLICNVIMQAQRTKFLEKILSDWSSFHQKSIEVHRTENNVERRAKEVRFFLHTVCPCVPLCRAGGTVAGKSSLERICPDFGRREKEGVWSKYLQGRALTKAKNVCSPAIFVNILLTKK